MFSFKVLHFFYKNAASLSVFGCKRVETLTPQQLEHLGIEKENREIDRLSFIVVVVILCLHRVIISYIVMSGVLMS